MYGLRQAPRCWFAKLAASLKKYGFQQSYSDYSLFTLQQGPVQLNVLVYVDDLIVSGNDSSAIASFKYLHTCFHMKVMQYLMQSIKGQEKVPDIKHRHRPSTFTPFGQTHQSYWQTARSKKTRVVRSLRTSQSYTTITADLSLVDKYHISPRRKDAGENAIRKQANELMMTSL